MEAEVVNDETLTQLLRDLYQTDEPYWDYTDFAAVQRCLSELQESRKCIASLESERAEMLAMLETCRDTTDRPALYRELSELIRRIEGGK